MGVWIKFLKNILGSDDPISSIGDHIGSLLNSFTGAHLTGAENEANAFTSAEAAKSRAWSEEMRATNFQAQVQDMRAAGLNPALMYANGGSSSTPSGASATSVAPNAPASLQEILAMAKLKKEMKILDAQARNIDSQTELNVKTAAKTETETSYLELQRQYYGRLTDAQINKINAEVGKLEAEVPYLRAQTSKANAEVGFINAQKLLTQKNTTWIDKLNTSLVALNEASAKKASAEELRAMAETAWTQFQHAYAAAYKTTVPSGGIAALLSFFEASFNPDNEAFKMFLDAIRESGAKVDVNNSTTNEYTLPHSNVDPGTLSNPYARPRN